MPYKVIRRTGKRPWKIIEILKDGSTLTVGSSTTKGDAESSINAVIKTITGEISFKGKLPVTISKEYKYGDGIIN